MDTPKGPLDPESVPPPWVASGAEPTIPNAVATVPAPTAAGPEVRGIARPLPLWLRLLVTLLVVLGLAGVAAAGVVTGLDWADAALRVGIAAGGVALLLALWTGVRSLAGMARRGNSRRGAQYLSAGIGIILLLAVVGASFAGQAPIHATQAGYLEGQHQWQQAITQFQRAGEREPASANIARVYNEWGEQLRDQQQYEDAIARFQSVITHFSAVADQVARAQRNAIATYLAWGMHDAGQLYYQGAVQHYDALLAATYCTAACQTQTSGLDATALLALGKQQLGGVSCAPAVATYQELTTRFPSAPEGQEAAKALAAPQPVKGMFNPFGTGIAILVPYTSTSAFLASLRSQLGAGKFKLSVAIQHDGSFQFAPLPQGPYALAWQNGFDQALGGVSVVFDASANKPAYIASVGPLCPYNFGTISGFI